MSVGTLSERMVTGMSKAGAGALSVEELLDAVLAEGHLSECPHRSTRSTVCDWCRWAIGGPELTALIDIVADIDKMLNSEVLVTVPGIVAAGRLFELFAEVDLDGIRIPSARGLVAQARDHTARRVEELRGRVDLATREGGPVERLCLQTATAFAATELRSDSPHNVTASPSSYVRVRFDELARSVSGEIQASILLPVVEQLHWQGMPQLVTQPEWSRRPPPIGDEVVRDRQLRASGVQPGTLEALVLESVIDRCTELLLEIGAALVVSGFPLTYQRPVEEQPFGSQLRSTLWRIHKTDWHSTFIDTGLAACWGTHVDQGIRSTLVPWVVDLGCRVLEGKGYGSALYRDPSVVTPLPDSRGVG